MKYKGGGTNLVPRAFPFFKGKALGMRLGRDRKVEAWEIRGWEGWEGYRILKILKGWEDGEIGQNYATMLSIYIW